MGRPHDSHAREKVLNFLTSREGRSVKSATIAARLRKSQGRVSWQLMQLEQEGKVKREATGKRDYRWQQEIPSEGKGRPHPRFLNRRPPDIRLTGVAVLNREPREGGASLEENGDENERHAARKEDRRRDARRAKAVC